MQKIHPVLLSFILVHEKTASFQSKQTGEGEGRQLLILLIHHLLFTSNTYLYLSFIITFIPFHLLFYEGIAYFSYNG